MTVVFLIFWEAWLLYMLFSHGKIKSTHFIKHIFLKVRSAESTISKKANFDCDVLK